MLRSLVWVCLLLAGCSASSTDTPPTTPAGSVEFPAKPSRIVRETAIEPKNFFFTPAPLRVSASPTFRPMNLPLFHAAASVWGSTGRDHGGKIYVGVSTEGDGYLSAHLIEFDPETREGIDRGGAVENLKRLNLAKPRENQNKIHTKIWQGTDGYLYFASMDETGENEDGSKLPTFGSHLWRVKPGSSDWEHLADIREAVIAAAAGGRYLYFLGYFGHVVYQWDIEKGKITNRVRVGSVGGHTTRNIIADSRGHVFVPRVIPGEPAKVVLVEHDEGLQEIATFPLVGYSTSPDSGSHGIVGVAPLKDDGFAFVTDRGRLYRLTPRSTGTAVVDLGNLHPEGECYPASLFSFDGEGMVVAVGHKYTNQEPSYEWISFDLRTRQARSEKLPIPTGTTNAKGLLVYGSTTRDDQGRLYFGGRYVRPDGDGTCVPMVWQVTP
jgi:hypothetical protein